MQKALDHINRRPMENPKDRTITGYELSDPSGNVIGSYSPKSAGRARNRRDRLDEAYGGYGHKVTPIFSK